MTVETFKSSLNTGKLPNEKPEANIISKRDQMRKRYYRSTTLISIPGNILECLVRLKERATLEKVHIVQRHQHRLKRGGHA